MPRIINGYNEYCATACTKSALLSYLPEPLLPPPQERDRLHFSNLGLAQSIPRGLNELGYEVDIVAWDEKDWLPAKKHDLFIGHGGINFERISRALPAQTVRIYFSTGIYWREFNRCEAERIYELTLRRGFLLPPDRAIYASEEYANQVAHGIICLGNQNAMDSYQKFPLVMGINNAVYPVTGNSLAKKNFDRGRNNFLFFSGRGCMHKGLDILLESFTGTNLHLHICQDMEPLFSAVYHDELNNQPNIHLHGHIPMRSSKFDELASLCNWTIGASACEGQSGATLECMAYGLIPILPQSANIDLDDFGISLPLNTIEGVRKTILSASAMGIDACRTRSQRTRQTVKEKYSIGAFNNNFKHAVEQIVKKAQLS